MATAISAKCPNCGAVLISTGNSEWVVCTFCDVRSAVSRGKTKRCLPAPPMGAPAIPVSSTRTLGRTLLLVGLVVGVMIVIGAIGFQRSGSLALLNVAMIGDPVLADVDGDGLDDVIVHGIVPGDEIIHLRAYSGKDGRSLWVSEPLLKAGVAELVATVPGLILAISGGATVVGLDEKTGKQRVRIRPERVEAVCERR